MTIPAGVSPALWTAPPTWTTQLAHSVARDNALTGTGPTGTGGNENFLYDATEHALNGRAVDDLLYFPASNYSQGAQSSFVDVDGTNLKLVLPATITGRVTGFWLLYYSIDNAAHNAQGYLSTRVDGSTIDGGSNNSGIASPGIAGFQAQGVYHLPFFFSGLAAGSHTFKLVWLNDASAGVSQGIAGSANIGIRGAAWEI